MTRSQTPSVSLPTKDCWLRKLLSGLQRVRLIRIETLKGNERTKKKAKKWEWQRWGCGSWHESWQQEEDSLMFDFLTTRVVSTTFARHATNLTELQGFLRQWQAEKETLKEEEDFWWKKKNMRRQRPAISSYDPWIRSSLYLSLLISSWLTKKLKTLCWVRVMCEHHWQVLVSQLKQLVTDISQEVLDVSPEESPEEK